MQLCSNQGVRPSCAGPSQRWKRDRPASLTTRRYAKIECLSMNAAAVVLKEELISAPKPQVASPICELTPESFDAVLTRDGPGTLVMVDFFTDYCGPCKLMQGEFEKLPTVFRKIKFAKYNCGTEGHEVLATKQRIKSLPTFRLYRGGKVLDEVVGARPVQLRQMLVHYHRP